MLSDSIRTYVFQLESPTNLLLINLLLTNHLLTNHLPQKNHQNKQRTLLFLLHQEKIDHVLLFEVVATDHTEEALILPLSAEDINVAVTTPAPFATQLLASVLVKAEFTPLF
jgi:hypothetical protein